MADIRLSNSSVSSSAIPLAGAEISVGWKNLTSVPVYPGVYTDGTAVSEVQLLGHQNPIFSIRGFLQETESDAMLYSLLTDFATSTDSTFVYDDIIASSGQQVVIESFDVNKRAIHKNDQIYDYSIKLVATT
jgi:hypothetical protein